MSAAEDQLPIAQSAPLAGRWACVDLETTGASPEFHRIVEVGIVQIDDGVIVDEWSTLVDPEVPMPPGIADFTGITDEMVAGAPTFAQVADEVLARCAGRTFVAHNARFDYGFLRAEFRRTHQQFSAPMLCTVKLSRRLYPDFHEHNLDAVLERHALTPRPRHRALPDAQIVAEFLNKIASSERGTHLNDAIAEVMRSPKVPSQLADVVHEVPDAPGIYRFYDSAGELLYLHRADNLHARVLEHFSRARPSSIDVRLLERVHTLDWQMTSGPWSAALLEIAELKRRQPLLSARLKADRSVWTIRLDDSAPSGLARIEPLGGESLDECYGSFRSTGAARRFIEQLARRHQLCWRALGLESGTEGSCVARQLGECRGVCIGREPVALHAARVRMALIDRQLRPWPFTGRVALSENRRGKNEWHVFEEWRYFGSARDADELQELLNVRADVAFDFDIYRLLSAALRDGQVSGT
jgi:DNA polymerase-3 subunit epsilon